MKNTTRVSALTIALVALTACFAFDVAQDAPKPKVAATIQGPLPAPAVPNPAPAPAAAPTAPQIPPLGSFELVPPQYFLDAYSAHSYKQIQEGWRDYVIREQSRAIVALQKRVEMLEKAGKVAAPDTAEQVGASKPAEAGEVKP